MYSIVVITTFIFFYYVGIPYIFKICAWLIIMYIWVCSAPFFTISLVHAHLIQAASISKMQIVISQESALIDLYALCIYSY